MREGSCNCNTKRGIMGQSPSRRTRYIFYGKKCQILRALRIHKKSASTHSSTCVVRFLTREAKQTTASHRAPDFYPSIGSSRSVVHWRPSLLLSSSLLLCDLLSFCCNWCICPLYLDTQIACCMRQEHQRLRDFTLTR